MFNVGDYIIYLKDVCKITSIKEKYLNDEDYYILTPINDDTLKLNIPVNNKSLRKLLDLDKIMEIIDNIQNIEIIEEDDKAIESEYKRLLASGNPKDLIKVIKTSYFRNKIRLDNKKKISDKDKNYFELAEKYLYPEFSIVLNKTIDETREFIINKVDEVICNG